MNPQPADLIGQSVGHIRITEVLGRPEVAEDFYRRCLDINTSIFPPGHPRRVAATEEFAEFLRDQGREAEAAEIDAMGTTPE